jgi:hypothetical protein
MRVDSVLDGEIVKTTKYVFPASRIATRWRPRRSIHLLTTPVRLSYPQGRDLCLNNASAGKGHGQIPPQESGLNPGNFGDVAKWLRRGSAKPLSPVRIRSSPPNARESARIPLPNTGAVSFCPEFRTVKTLTPTDTGPLLIGETCPPYSMSSVDVSGTRGRGGQCPQRFPGNAPVPDPLLPSALHWVRPLLLGMLSAGRPNPVGSWT